MADASDAPSNEIKRNPIQVVLVGLPGNGGLGNGLGLYPARLAALAAEAARQNIDIVAAQGPAALAGEPKLGLDALVEPRVFESGRAPKTRQDNVTPRGPSRWQR